jgi:integrase
LAVPSKWADYDVASGTLLLRDPKGRGGVRDHLVPVSEWGSTLLHELGAIHAGSGCVFEATNGKALGLDAVSAQFAEVARSVSASSKATGEGFQLRDLRRTVETRLASLRVDKETRAQLLSHGRTSGVQAQHYDRWHYLDQKRAAIAVWEAHLRAVIDGTKPGARVIAMAAARLGVNTPQT